jgi:uncharacterized membrane protein
MKPELRIFNRSLKGLLVLLGIACAFAAQATGYRYTVIDYPGADAGTTTFWGINNGGKIVGNATIGGSSEAIPFIYDLHRKLFTLLATVPGKTTTALGINDQGVVVGGASDSVSETGFILTDGAFTFFTDPVSPNTEARAINEKGVLVGYAYQYLDPVNGPTPPEWSFVYRPKRDSFVNFLVSSTAESIAQGINDSNTVVGNVEYPAASTCTLSVGSCGFVRLDSGAITLFTVNGFLTRARRINNFGLMTGYYIDATAGAFIGFVTQAPTGSAVQSLTVPAAGLLSISGYNMYPEGISDLGTVVGIVEDAGGGMHGFIATPNY